MFGKHSLDLEKQFTFYASYHNNPINVLIHILCIWPILATGLVILQVRNWQPYSYRHRAESALSLLVYQVTTQVRIGLKYIHTY